MISMPFLQFNQQTKVPQVLGSTSYHHFHWQVYPYVMRKLSKLLFEKKAFFLSLKTDAITM